MTTAAGGAPLAAVVVLLVAVLVGALVQSSVGLGLGLVVTPVVALLVPERVPGAVILLSAVLPVLTLVHDHRHVDWRGVAAVLAGRLPGSLVGLWLVLTVSARGIGVVVGVVVLVAVVLTATRVKVPVRPRPWPLAAAGFVGGVSGTATSIGGPPVALLYQHRPAAQIRATLAVYFLAGHVMALLLLSGAGVLTGADVRLTLLMLPALLAGFALAGPLRPWLDGPRTRAAVLVLCAASALALLVRPLLGWLG